MGEESGKGWGCGLARFSTMEAALLPTSDLRVGRCCPRRDGVRFGSAMCYAKATLVAKLYSLLRFGWSE